MDPNQLTNIGDNSYVDKLKIFATNNKSMIVAGALLFIIPIAGLIALAPLLTSNTSSSTEDISPTPNTVYTTSVPDNMQKTYNLTQNLSFAIGSIKGSLLYPDTWIVEKTSEISINSQKYKAFIKSQPDRNRLNPPYITLTAYDNPSNLSIEDWINEHTQPDEYSTLPNKLYEVTSAKAFIEISSYPAISFVSESNITDTHIPTVVISADEIIIELSYEDTLSEEKIDTLFSMIIESLTLSS